MNNQNKYKQTLEKLITNEHPKQALHYGWEELNERFSEILSMLFDREIYADVTRSEYYDWETDLSSSPLTQEEEEIILSLTNAPDYDRESYCSDDCHVTELSQNVSRMLISKTLPFPATSSFADSEGVWFIGNPDMSNVPDSTNLFMLSFVDLDNLDIISLYDLVAVEMGVNPCFSTIKYDCTKIKVAKNLLDAIIESYKKKMAGVDPKTAEEKICTDILQFGPKHDETLTKNSVLVDSGFIKRKR